MRHDRSLILPCISLAVLVLLSPTCLPAQAWSGIVSPSRAIDWSNAGVPGGVPSGSWATCTTSACTLLNTPSNVTAANINAAIASAPANSVVILPAGTFTMSTGLVWQHVSYVAVRGQGANQTILVFTGYNGCGGEAASVICMESADSNYNGGPSNTANWTANYSAGTTSITLDNVSNLGVGWPLILDQLDDTSDSGQIYICSTLSTCAYTSNDGGADRVGRAQSQMVTVTSISGSRSPYTVGITPGIYMPNWRSSQTPQAWWSSSPVFEDGIENVTLNSLSASSPNNIAFWNCNGCWAINTASVMPTNLSSETQVRIFESNRCTIANNYFYQTASTATVQYGVEPFLSSDCLIQNNIFEKVSAPVPVNGSCSGCVISYNFDVNDWFQPTTWLNVGEFVHSVADFTLFEGNVGAGFYSDNSHGTHHLMTVFRSAGSGYQQNVGGLPSDVTTPTEINAFSRYYNIIGNVWGSLALPHTKYIYTGTSGSASDGYIYAIGSGDEVANDSNTNASIMLWGNYSVVTQSSDTPPNSGIRFVSSEVPSRISYLPNSVPSSNTLPRSFYLSSQPSWWTSGLNWPAIGPDVTTGTVSTCLSGTNKAAYVTTSSECPSGTLSGLGGHVSLTPAMNCYLNVMGGSIVGQDSSALVFNPSACYASNINPPTGLTATVQ